MPKEDHVAQSGALHRFALTFTIHAAMWAMQYSADLVPLSPKVGHFAQPGLKQRFDISEFPRFALCFRLQK